MARVTADGDLDGDLVEHPRHSRKAERTLQKVPQCVSRRKEGGTCRTKAMQLLAKAHQHVKWQREGFHHKTALARVRQYDAIYVEAIQPAALRRRPAPKPDGAGGDVRNGAGRKAGRNTAMQDAGWGQFLSILASTAAWAGKRVAAASSASTTQDGSGCGRRIQKALRVRTHACPSCGLVVNRDANAATDIPWRGQRLREVPAVTGATNREPVGLSPVRRISCFRG